MRSDTRLWSTNWPFRSNEMRIISHFQGSILVHCVGNIRTAFRVWRNNQLPTDAAAGDI